MTTTLTVIVFPDQRRAEDVYRALSAMRRRELYSLEESLLLTRSSSGQPIVESLGQEAIGEKQRTLEAVAYLMLDSMTGTIDEAQQHKLLGAGIDVHFIATVAASFQHEFSALFFLIRTGSRADASELINVLSLFRGKIAHTTLTDQARAFLDVH